MGSLSACVMRANLRVSVSLQEVRRGTNEVQYTRQREKRAMRPHEEAQLID